MCHWKTRGNKKPTLYDRTEILVNSDAFKRLFFQNQIKQGYLSSVAERTVRVRIKGDKAI
jgi:CYTH domain-containing protein